MKVLQVIPSISEKSGGPSQAIFPLCRALLEQGVDVVLATTDHEVEVSSSERARSEGQRARSEGQRAKSEGQRARSEEQRARSEAVEALTETRNPKSEIPNLKGVPTIFFPRQWGESFKYSRPFAQWLHNHVSDFDLVHIHAVFNHACIAAARACREKRVPYVVRPLGTLDPWSMQQKSLRKKVFWYAGIKKMLSEATAIHYTTIGEQQAVETSLHLNHGFVIPLGVELKAAREASAAAEFSAELSALRDHPYVLVLSRLHPKKALDILLQAFLSLHQRDEFQSWHLVLAGAGPDDYVAALKRMVAEDNATGFVTFPGWLQGDQKEAALRNAQLLALTSYQENFGLCVMESLARGVPVLISPHVNLAPEIEMAGAGWITKVDKSSVEAALEEALSSGSERTRRGAAGQRLAEDFSWPAIAEKLISMYASVLQARTGPTTLAAI